jgi:hypothetical protein
MYSPSLQVVHGEQPTPSTPVLVLYHPVSHWHVNEPYVLVQIP